MTCAIRLLFFINRVLNIWNSLPNDVVLCDTINKFESYLDKSLSGNIKNFKILCMIIKLKFTELEVEVHIT